MQTGKFSNPFKTLAVYITQTYHMGGTTNKAIDASNPELKEGTPIYAIADGEIRNRSSLHGSYCTQYVPEFGVYIFYVHTFNWLPVGTKVKKGQKICEIAGKDKNGGYPIHLHLGLGKKNGSFPLLMDYMGRDVIFRTNGPAIKKLWFNSNGDIDWSHFKDYKYIPNQTTAPVAPVESTNIHKECEETIKGLSSLLDASKALSFDLGKQVDKLKADIGVLETSMQKKDKEITDIKDWSAKQQSASDTKIRQLSNRIQQLGYQVDMTDKDVIVTRPTFDILVWVRDILELLRKSN